MISHRIKFLFAVTKKTDFTYQKAKVNAFKSDELAMPTSSSEKLRDASYFWKTNSIMKLASKKQEKVQAAPVLTGAQHIHPRSTSDCGSLK